MNSFARVNDEKPRKTVRREAKKFFDKMREECKKATGSYQQKYDESVFDSKGNMIPKKQDQFFEKIKQILFSNHSEFS